MLVGPKISREPFFQIRFAGERNKLQKKSLYQYNTLLPIRGYPKYYAKNLLVRYSYCLFCDSTTQGRVLKRTVTLFGQIICLSDSEIHCVNLFHINDHVFANVVFECHDELHVLSNLLPLPSVIQHIEPPCNNLLYLSTFLTLILLTWRIG